jgi:hypothetical protein
MILTFFYHSPFVANFLQGVRFNVKFMVNENEYAQYYFFLIEYIHVG